MGTNDNNMLHVEITLNDESDDIVRELLSYLEHTNKIKHYRILKKARPLAKKTEPKLNTGDEITTLLEQWKNDKVLVRVTALKNKGVKLNIACKIINVDATTGIVTLYDVDSKKVESVLITELEDIHAC